MSLHNDTQYVILKKLGEGGMGTVFLAEDTLLKRKVAIKELNKPATPGAGTPDDRFQQEALALARLNHPNITHLYSFLPKEGTYWMVMEYVLGETLDEWLQKHRATTPIVAASILVQLLNGLNHAHRKGIIHRDLKPANVMVSEEGEVKIMDFGIARIRDSQRITQHGKSVGTLEYMAPEQIQGNEGDERTDVYAAGTILYELLAGRPPFRSDTDYQLMKAKLEENAAPLPSSTPPALQRVITKALDRNPDRRYPDVLALKDAIEQCFTARLLRENELINELNKPVQPINLAAVPPAPLQSQRPSFLSSSPNATLNTAKVKLGNLKDIKANSALFLLLAVVVVCAGLLIWNHSRQQTIVEQSVVDTSSLPVTTAVPLPETSNDTDKPKSPVNEHYIIEGRQTPADNAVSGNQENSDPKKKIKKTGDEKPVVAKTTPKEEGKKDAVVKEETPPPPVVEEKKPAETKEEYKGSVKIPAGLEIPVVLDETLSSEETSKDGNQVRLHCADDIKAGGRTIIRRGALVTGKIVDVVPGKGRRKGLIGFVIQRVEAVDGSKVKLHSDRYRQFGEEGKSSSFNAGQTFYVKLGKGEID